MLQATKQVREPRPEKIEAAKKIESLAKKWSVIVSTDLTKVRSAQIMALRKSFRNEVDIVIPKNTLAARGLKNAGLKQIKEFVDALKGQKALMFTNIDPFKLNLIFERNKVSLPARAGDTATGDIIVPAGNTGLPAGPILSDFREAGVTTKIDTGNVLVVKDSVVIKMGEVVSSKLAGLLSKLGLKPIKAGISISIVYWNGLILHGEDVRIDLDKYRENIGNAARYALSLAVESSYPSTEALPLIIGKAGSYARCLALTSAYVTEDTIIPLITTAHSRALTIENIVESKA